MLKPMTETVFVALICAIGILVPITICLVVYHVIKPRKEAASVSKSYGTCESTQTTIPLQIKVTQADNDVTDGSEGKLLIADDRRFTMPCILLSCEQKTLERNGSSESLIEDGNNRSSFFLSSFVSPARRFSDYLLTESHGETRKNSVRPDRFSIVSLNLEIMHGNNSELQSYDILNLYGHGKLCFSLVFNDTISRLYVTINKALYLNSSKMRNLAGFYVKVYLLNVASKAVLQMHKSEIVSANKNPMFEQTFSYFLPKQTLLNVMLKFVVKQAHNKTVKNEFLGGFMFNLNDVDLIFHPEWFQELWRDLKGDLQTTHNLGEVLISLKLTKEPSNSITVNIQRARNLRIRQHDNSVFTRCTLLMGNTALKTKRSVTVKSDIVCPYLDHESVFSMEKISAMEVGLAVHICSRSKIGFSHLLGKVTLGSLIYTDDKSSMAHWADIIAYPDRSITKWHKIV